MATVWMDEHELVGTDTNGRVIPVAKHPIAVQSKTLSGTSQTMTLNGRTKFVALHANGGFHVNVDAAATTADKHIPGDGLERWIDVSANDDVRVIEE